jgi:hypothetical protein
MTQTGDQDWRGNTWDASPIGTEFQAGGIGNPNDSEYRIQPPVAQPLWPANAVSLTNWFIDDIPSSQDDIFECPTDLNACDIGDGFTTSPVHTFPGGGTYEVCLTVSNQYSSDTFCKTLQFATVATGEAAPAVAVAVFPNPCQEGTNVILSDYLPKNASITLYDAMGRPALRQPLLTGWNSLDLSHTPPGLYFYEIMEEGKRLKSGKLVRGE